MSISADTIGPAAGRPPSGKEAAGLARALVDSGYASIVLDRLAGQACRILDVERCCVLVRDERHPGTSIVAAGCGLDEDLIGSRLEHKEGALPSIVYRRPDCAAPPSVPPATRARHTPSLTAHAPFGWGGTVRGELSAETDRPSRTFSEREMELLGELAQLVGAALLHFEAKEEAYAAARDGVAAVVRTLDERDRYTAWHSEEVVELARRVGTRLGLGAAELFEVQIAALLHDFGKVGVPDSVLNKPGPLDPEEMSLMQLHPVWGAELLAGIPGLEAVAAIVRFHHERIDGTGYPTGLSGGRIPLASRIIAACDAFHAMTSDRPYRAALDHQTALAELRECAGSQFDPAVVEALAAEVRSRPEAPAGVR